MMKRKELAWSLAARPKEAEEGSIFVDLSSDAEYTFTGGKWLLNKPTEVISETEEAEKVPEPLPKKKTTRKKTASKTAEE